MRDRKRLFIAIDISREAKERLRAFKDRLYDFPGRWTSLDKLHITLSFLGNIREEDIPSLFDVIEKTVESHNPFSLTTESVSFDRDFLSAEKNPRMIWAKVGESEKLQKLYRDLASAYLDLPFSVHSQRPTLSAHITLCRFNSISLKRWHSDELPQINEDINVSFPVESIHLMESKLRRGEPEYFVLQSFQLGA